MNQSRGFPSLMRWAVSLAAMWGQGRGKTGPSVFKAHVLSCVKSRKAQWIDCRDCLHHHQRAVCHGLQERGRGREV